MFRKLRAGMLAILLIGVIGCSAPVPSPPPSNPTPFPLATVPVLPSPAIALSPSVVPTQTAQPTPVSPVPTLQATAVRTRPVTVISTATARAFTRVKIFLIALNDNGKSGPLVGCGDSVVGVERETAPTAAPLTAALKELLALHAQTYGQSGFYNALYQSDLQVERVAIVNGAATIQLTGTLMLGGVCDDPRVAAQIQNTALQFSTVRSVVVLLNGVPLEQMLGGK